MIAVCEAARNIVCSGAIPAAITNCLNFGNPYNPEVYYQFVYALKGMSDACLKLDTPVTGGNVSFYNQSPDGAVYPTPTIGMVGVIENIEARMTMDFKQAGDHIYMIGSSKNDISCSEYLHKLVGVKLSPAPFFELEEEYQIQQTILKLIDTKLIQSAHDIAEGGLFTALMESGLNRNLGFTISTNNNIRKDAFLFGEAQSRVVVSVKSDNVNDFEAMLATSSYEKLGEVTSSDLKIDGDNWGNITEWKSTYDNALEELLNA
jgi:phosphoribosylformylglycinamidine synthase